MRALLTSFKLWSVLYFAWMRGPEYELKAARAVAKFHRGRSRWYALVGILVVLTNPATLLLMIVLWMAKR